tara:strand:+ start:3647 stop:3820 length:174 start_codon:yes stop_codon:yes gene_type:complete
MIVVHAAPKTHPGGVHGALSNSEYQSEATPSPVNKPPIASVPKFKSKRIRMFTDIFI